MHYIALKFAFKMRCLCNSDALKAGSDIKHDASNKLSDNYISGCAECVAIETIKLQSFLSAGCLESGQSGVNGPQLQATVHKKNMISGSMMQQCTKMLILLFFASKASESRRYSFQTAAVHSNCPSNEHEWRIPAFRQDLRHKNHPA